MAVSDQQREDLRMYCENIVNAPSGKFLFSRRHFAKQTIALLDDLDERGCEHGDVLRSNIGEAISAWRAYVAYLQAKYPAAPGTLWALTCPHHKRIDAIFRNIDKVGGK